MVLKNRLGVGVLGQSVIGLLGTPFFPKDKDIGYYPRCKRRRYTRRSLKLYKDWLQDRV